VRAVIGVSPYLWPEMLIEATRSTRESHTSSGCRKVMDAVVVIAAIQAEYLGWGGALDRDQVDGGL